jgi:hypothetical protein
MAGPPVARPDGINWTKISSSAPIAHTDDTQDSGWFDSG